MLALWALFLLSAMVISWALDLNSRLGLSSSANRVLEAEAMACSGSEVALHPLVKPDSVNLSRQVNRQAGYEAHITGEGGRLNINWLIAGEDAARLGILKRYLEIKGVELNERDRMVDNLLDYVQPSTGIHHLNSDPESDDYHLKHALLTRIDELKKVRRWEEFTSQPGWDTDLTLNSNGPVDVTWASREVLMALPGMNDQMIDSFLQLRRGPDGIDGTADDRPFKSPAEIAAALYLNDQQFKALQPFITIKDPVFRIVSVGRSGDALRTVQMVVRKGAAGSVPQLITWREF